MGEQWWRHEAEGHVEPLVAGMKAPYLREELVWF